MLIRALVLASTAVAGLAIAAPASAVLGVKQDKYVIPSSHTSTTVTIPLDRQVTGQSVLYVAVACSACVNNGPVPADLTVTDTLGTTWLTPSSLGTSIQDSKNNIGVEIFLGTAPVNGNDTITVSGYPVDAVHVFEVTGEKITDPMIIDTGAYDCTAGGCNHIGTIDASDITGGAYAIVFAEGSGGMSSCAKDPWDSNNFTLLPYCAQPGLYVPPPTVSSQSIDPPQSATITAQPTSFTLWGGEEQFNTLQTANMVVDTNITDGSVVYVMLAVDPVEKKHGAHSEAVTRHRLTHTAFRAKKEMRRLATAAASPFSYQWLELAPGATSYVNATDCVDPHALTCSFVSTATTLLGEYSFELRVTDSRSGLTATSPPSKMTVADKTPPTAPSNLTATTLSVSAVQLAWTGSTDNTHVAGYRIYQNGVLIATLPASARGYIIQGLSGAVTYSYTVVAFDGSGNASRPSNTATATTTTPDTTPPTAPGALASAFTGGTATKAPSVKLTWTASSDNIGVSGYRVSRGGVLQATLPASTLSYTNSGLSPATSYTYTVVAFDAAGNVSVGASLSVTTPALDTTPPTTPSNFTADATGASSIRLTWTASTDNVAVDGYRVFRGGVLLATLSASTSSYTGAGLAPSTSYTYTVVAFDAAGNVSVAARATVSTHALDTTPPTPPGDVAATASGTSSVRLTWTASTDSVGVKGYRVLRGGVLLATLSSSAASYTGTGLSPATSYVFTVVAFDGAGNVSDGASATVTTQALDTTPPTAPSALTATATGTSSVRLTWTASTDNVAVDGYHVFRDGVLVATLSGSAASYTGTGLSPATSYSYTLDAFDAAGNVSGGAGVSVTTLALDTVPPTAPAALTATATGTSSVRLTWTASTDNVAVTGYRVSRGGSLLATLSGSASSYNASGLAASASYSFTVVAFDAAGNVSDGATVTVTTQAPDTTPPTAPSALSATVTAGTLTKGPSVRLSWSASTDNVGVKGYRVFRDGALVATLSGSSGSFVNSGLSSGTTYSYSVVAFDAAGNVSDAATLSVTTPALDTTPPSAPGNLTATTVSTSAIKLTWTASIDNVGVKGYRVYRGGVLVVTLSSSATSFTSSSLSSGTSYSFTVVAFDVAGNVSDGATVTASTS